MEEDRRSFAMSPQRGTYDKFDLSRLDPADPDERRILIEAEHPELHAALRAEIDEIDRSGEPMSPRLHIAMHEIVANQLWDDDPPEAWETPSACSEPDTTATRCCTCWARSRQTRSSTS